MARINYLLGAGASANAVPVVNALSKEIQFMIDEINQPGFEDALKGYGTLTVPFKNVIKSLEEDLIWLMSKEKEHATIDTYAKKLTIRKDLTKLNRLKIVFSLFLSVHQANKRVDYRYDYFLAALLEENARFTDDVNLVSWNYDNQLELAYSEYAQVHNLNECAVQLNLTLKNSELNKINPDGFNFLKVNGSTSVFDEHRFRSYYFLPKLKYDSPGELWHEALTLFTKLKKSRLNHSALSFAWEKWGNSSDYFKKVSETFSNTEVLVIIGYSFPFFNRLIDRAILKDAVNLKKIYIQDIYPENILDKLLESLPKSLTINKDSIKLIKNVQEFLIPHEL
jgi:hypothetical protein